MRLGFTRDKLKTGDERPVDLDLDAEEQSFWFSLPEYLSRTPLHGSPSNGHSPRHGLPGTGTHSGHPRVGGNSGRCLTILFAACALLMLSYNELSLSSLLSGKEAEVGSQHVLDAVVLVVAGSLARGPAAELAVKALRLNGRWDGPIVVLTDALDELQHLNSSPSDLVRLNLAPSAVDGNTLDQAPAHTSSLQRPEASSWEVTLVPVSLPSAENEAPGSNRWMMEVKALKTRVFEEIDNAVQEARHWKRLLYIDVDVWTARDLGQDFMSSIITTERAFMEKRLKRPDQSIRFKGSELDATMPPSSNAPWLMLFDDCAAHAVGWCAGCDKWNTGVMIVRRSPTTDQCLNSWRTVIESGRFSTDQESLEAAVAESSHHECSAIASLPNKHLLFMKDYLALPGVLFVTGWPTFCHVTAANHIQDQDWLYRKLVGSLRRSLNLDDR